MSGETLGHVCIGLTLLIIGLWHLFSSIKLHSLHPNSYLSLPWFPFPKLRYLEPIAIMSVAVLYISLQLFIGQETLSPDGTIRAKSLPHLEHSIITFSYFVYAFFIVLLDKINSIYRVPAQNGLLHLLQAVAFGQQLLILHLHSADHMGIEGHYHWLLQIVTFVCLISTLLSIGYSKSFICSFVRAFSLVFIGVWLIVTGGMLWTPELVPKGCFLKRELGRASVLCHDDGALDRAKALLNIQFGFYLIGLTVFSMLLYLVVIKLYSQEKVEYMSLTKLEEQDVGDHKSTISLSM